MTLNRPPIRLHIVILLDDCLKLRGCREGTQEVNASMVLNLPVDTNKKSPVNDEAF
jgi:hypothetical protein